jgi:imidazolonepropionase-like amidohydrolase
VQKYSEYIVIADALLTEKGFVTDAAIKIKDGLIIAISGRAQADKNVKVLDFSGYTLAPCFCDYHLHFFKRNSGRMKEISDGLTSCGIAKVYDGGDPHGYGMDVKKSVTDRIDVQTAGHALYKQGSYGKYIGRGVGTLKEADDIIEVLYQGGADYIKVVNSGVFDPEEGTISPGGFTTRELKHIVACAGTKGLHVACHANGHDAIREAIEAGVSMIIHGLGVSSESLALMAEKGIAFVPTVNAFASLALQESEKRVHVNVREAVTQHLAAVKEACDKGVNVLPGSDSGPAVIPYGSTFHKELNLFQEAGMNIEKILLSAAAGKLERGAKADFLILDGLAVKHVFRGGFLSTHRTGT